MIFGLLALEALFLAAGFLLNQPLLGAGAGMALVFLILAYRSPALAWALVWLAFPFSIEMRLPGGNALYVPTEPMVALSLAAWAALVISKGVTRLPRSTLHVPLAVLALVALLSIALSPFPLVGLKGWIAAAAYAAFAYLFCFLNRSDVATRGRWIPWVVGSGVFWALYGTSRLMLAGVSLQHAYGSARPFFTEHGTYSAYLAMILPLSLLLALERRGRERYLCSTASLVIALGVVFSFTRAAWVSLAIVLPVTATLWGLWRRSLRPAALLATIALIAVVVIVGIGVGQRIARQAGSVAERDNVSNLERINRWMAAAEMVRARPWLGVGFAEYPAVYPAYRRKVILTELVYEHMGAHSEVLRLLSEMGVVGLLAGCWFLGAAALLGLRTFRRAADPRARLIALALLSGLGTYAIHGLFNSYLGLDKVTIPFWSALGVLAAQGRELGPGPS